MPEIGSLGLGSCGGRGLSIFAHEKDHAELGTDVVYLANAEAMQVELIELAWLGKPLDSYAHVTSDVHILVRWSV
jgi:hypothetical protein